MRWRSECRSMTRTPIEDDYRFGSTQFAKRMTQTRQRLVMQLRDVEGMSYQEAAEALDIPLTQVKINLFRARQTMKSILSNKTPQV